MTKPIRIAQIVGKCVGGGVESVIMNYYKYIDYTKIQFDFFIDEDSTTIPYEEIESLGGKVILIPPYQKLFKYQRKLKKMLKNGEYEIVHSHINTMSIFPLFAAMRAGVKIRIAHSHSITNPIEKKRNFIKQILRPFSKIFATHYMCCSEVTGRWLFGNRTYNCDKVYLLNNAITIHDFVYNEKIRKDKRNELHIKDDTLVIGHIGRFVNTKNHKFLIEIFNEVHKKEPKSILLLAGQGPLINKIQEMVNSMKLSNVVKFLGQRLDANELYQAFDVFVLPSLYEGLPVVGVEAQTSGLLCVFSDEMTKEAKILDSTTFMSLSNSAEEWAKVILDSIKTHKRTNTMEEVSKKGYDIKNEVSKLENKYIELLKNE